MKNFLVKNEDDALKISLITAVYNRRSVIESALSSVASQQNVSIEHLIQDGGSSDGSLEFIRDWQHSQLQIVSERDDGIYDALNRGIIRATGNVIGFLHSDDMLANVETLSKVAQILADPDIDGVYGDLEYVTADETQRVIRHWNAGSYSPSKLAWGWMPPHPTLYLKRQVYDRFGMYDTNFRISADYEAMLRFLIKGRIRLAYIPEVMVRMRVGGASNRSLNQIAKKSAEDLRAIQRHRAGGLGTLLAKNIRKTSQFIPKGSKPSK